VQLSDIKPPLSWVRFLTIKSLILNSPKISGTNYSRDVLAIERPVSLDAPEQLTGKITNSFFRYIISIEIAFTKKDPGHE